MSSQCFCEQVGAHLTEQLKQMQSKHDIIGDVRGKGLMLGVEMVRDRTTKEPAGSETAQVSACIFHA